MPAAEIRNGMYQPPRVHGWTAVLTRTDDNGSWQMNAVFSSAYLADLWTRTMNDVGMQTQCVEVRFAPGENHGR